MSEETNHGIVPDEMKAHIDRVAQSLAQLRAHDADPKVIANIEALSDCLGEMAGLHVILQQEGSQMILEVEELGRRNAAILKLQQQQLDAAGRIQMFQQCQALLADRVKLETRTQEIEARSKEVMDRFLVVLEETLHGPLKDSLPWLHTGMDDLLDEDHFKRLQVMLAQRVPLN